MRNSMKYFLLLSALMLLTVGGGVYAAEGSVAETKDVAETKAENWVAITTPGGPYVELSGDSFRANLRTDRTVTVTIRIGGGSDTQGSVNIGGTWYEVGGNFGSEKIVTCTLSPNSEIYGAVYKGMLSLRLEKVTGEGN